MRSDARKRHHDEQAASLEDVLAAHQYVASMVRGVSRCACGIQFHGMPHNHRAHVADAIRTHLALDGEAP